MSDKQMYVIRDENVRQRALAGVSRAPIGHVVSVTPANRSLEASAKFHAICGDLARQLPYAGKSRTLEEWKLLIVSGHAVATKSGMEIVAGLESEWLNIRESTARMSVARMNSLIEYALAYGAMNGVNWSN